MFAGVCFGQDSDSFLPEPLRRVNMALKRAQDVFMPKNINCITINITLEGIEKIKLEKIDNKTV